MPGTQIPQGSTSEKQTRHQLALVFFVLIIVAVLVTAAHAQTYTVLHSFAGAPYDGLLPEAGVIMDASGNLWGTTEGGGAQNFGTIFRLAPDGTMKSYSFRGTPDGRYPESGLLLYKGSLYGTTTEGGDYNFGTVFKLDRINHLTVLHSFTGGDDGATPSAGLVRDAAGNMYGTAGGAGANGVGVIFKLDVNGIFSVVYAFTGGTDGSYPNSTMALDTAGNLYGTTTKGGTSHCALSGCGTVFRLNPAGNETVLYRFLGKSDGAVPLGVIKVANNLYGTTLSGSGTIFELTPGRGLATLYNFTDPREGTNPEANVSAGNHSLYGTTVTGGANDFFGTVFQLDANGMKTLHSFNGSDGRVAYAPLLVDAAGNIYGTTSFGGDYDLGVVFKITPQ